MVEVSISSVRDFRKGGSCLEVPSAISESFLALIWLFVGAWESNVGENEGDGCARA